MYREPLYRFEKACVPTASCNYIYIYFFFLVSLTEIYAKLKSNSLIQAEPPELHFSGFELEKDYIKILVRKTLPNI